MKRNKILAMLLAVVMIMQLGTSAFAVTTRLPSSVTTPSSTGTRLPSKITRLPSASKVVSEVEVTFDEPVANEGWSKEITTNSTGIEKVTISWLNSTAFMNKDEKYVAGEKYEARIFATLEEGYSWADEVTFNVNGKDMKATAASTQMRVAPTYVVAAANKQIENVEVESKIVIHVHVWSDWIRRKAPTCTEPGRVEQVCLRDGCDASEEQEIPALGHDWSDWETIKPATSTEPGKEARECVRDGCNASEERDIPAIVCSHPSQTLKIIAPSTCTENGMLTWICVLCSNETPQQSPALGHDWSDWKIIKPATCTEKGVEGRVCVRGGCNAIEERDIPEHDWSDWEIIKAPTYAKPGKMARECVREGCDASEERDIPTLHEHAWSDWETIKPATSTEPGKEARECTIEGCNASEERDIPALATSYYEISVTSGNGGEISPSNVKVEKGNDQKFTIKSADDYKIKDVVIDGKSVGVVKEYTFKNVIKEHTIKATFEKIEEKAEEKTEEEENYPWTKTAEWAEEIMIDAYEEKLIPTVLEDEDYTKNITRLEFASVAVKLYEKLTGTKAVPVANNPFVDTNDKEVLKAYNIGITAGMSATEFAPNNEITREQMATMMTNTLTKAGINTKRPDNVKLFADDNEVSGWASNSVYYMSSVGIIKGMGENKFSPLGTATREQALTVSVNSFNELGK